MIVHILLGMFLGGILGAAGALHGVSRARSRKPSTDREHQIAVELAGQSLNLAMHHARAAGLNPTIKVSPLDDELAPGSRPIRASVERVVTDPGHIEATTIDAGKLARMPISSGTISSITPPGIPGRTPEQLAHVGERRFSKYFNDREVEVVRYIDDNNWWFKIVGEEKRGIAKARTAFSQMPRTREEAYNVP